MAEAIVAQMKELAAAQRYIPFVNNNSKKLFCVSEQEWKEI